MYILLWFKFKSHTHILDTSSNSNLKKQKQPRIRLPLDTLEQYLLQNQYFDAYLVCLFSIFPCFLSNSYGCKYDEVTNQFYSCAFSSTYIPMKRVFVQTFCAN